jgi:hypothetical protein
MLGNACHTPTKLSVTEHTNTNKARTHTRAGTRTCERASRHAPLPPPPPPPPAPAATAAAATAAGGGGPRAGGVPSAAAPAGEAVVAPFEDVGTTAGGGGGGGAGVGVVGFGTGDAEAAAIASCTARTQVGSQIRRKEDTKKRTTTGVCRFRHTTRDTYNTIRYKYSCYTGQTERYNETWRTIL